MSENTNTKASRSVGAGIGLSGLAGIIGGIVSFCTTPSFVGATGLGMAAVVGLGTWAGSFLLAIPAAIAGLVVGGITLGAVGLGVGLLTRKMAAVAVLGGIGAIGGLITGGIGGVVGGSVLGYNVTRNALVEKISKTSFNDAAAKPSYTTTTQPALQPEQSVPAPR